MSSVVIIAANARSLIANRGDLIRKLKQHGHEVTALVPRFDVLPEVESLEIPYELIRIDRRHMNILKDLLSCGELWRKLRRLSPDLVFAYGIKPIVYGTLTARMARVSRVFSMITGLGYLFTSKSLKARVGRLVAKGLYAVALPLNKMVFFQNPDDRRAIGRLGPISLCKKIAVTAGSGINLEHFSPAPLPDGPLRFLVIARLLRDKGVIEFCETAMELHAVYPEVKFEVLGPHDSSLPNSIPIKQIERYKSAGVVRFHSATKDVRPYIANCSMLVLPSYREGTPRAVLEAMAMGRGIITTDAPGCRETVVHGGNGLLVKPADVVTLREAIQRVIENPSLIKEMGEKSLAIARTKYDVNIVNNEIISNLFSEKNR